MKKFVRGHLGRGLSMLIMVLMMVPGLLTPFTQRANAQEGWGKKVFILPFQVTAPNPPDTMGREILNELCVDLQHKMSVSVIPLERDSIFLAIAYQQHDLLDKSEKATLLEKIHNEYAKRLKEYKNDEDRALLMASYDVASDPTAEVTSRNAAISYLGRLLKADSIIYGTVDTYEFSDTDGAQAKIHLSATQVKFDTNYNVLPSQAVNVIGKSAVRPDGGGSKDSHNSEAVRVVGERLASLLTGNAKPTPEELGDTTTTTVSSDSGKGGNSFWKSALPILGGLVAATLIYSSTRHGSSSSTPPPPPPTTGEGRAYPQPDGAIWLQFTVTPAAWANARTFEVYRSSRGTRSRAGSVPDAGPYTKAQVDYNAGTGVITIVDRPLATGLFTYQIKVINADGSYTLIDIFNGTTANPNVDKNPVVGPYMPPAATGLQVTKEVGGIVDIAWTYPAGSRAELITRIQILARTGSIWKEITPLLPVAPSATTAKIALSGTTDIQVIALGVGDFKSSNLTPETLTVTITPTTLTPASNVQAVLAPLPNWTKANINVTWTPSPDPLVTGYKVFRITANTKAYVDAATTISGFHKNNQFIPYDTKAGGISLLGRTRGDRAPAGAFLIQDNVPVTTSRIVDTDIHDGTKYTYVIEAVRTGTTLTADAISNDIWVDVPPANVTAVIASPSPGQVLVSWTAPTTNADGSPISLMTGGGYNVYRLNAAPVNTQGYTRAEILAGKKINTNLIPFATHNIVDNTVTNRVNYYYAIEVIDGATPAQSSFGPYPYYSATPMPAVSQLTVTSPNLTLTAGATNVPITVTVSGSDGLGLAGYQVSMSAPGAGKGAVSPVAPATATTDASGNASFTYTAPLPVDVTAQKTASMTATVVGVAPALTKTITFTINPLTPVAVQLYADNNSVRANGLTALTARIVDVSGLSIPNQPVTIACTDQTFSYLDPLTSTYKPFTTPFTGVTSSTGDLRLNIKAGPNTGTATFTATSGTLFSAIANIDVLGIPAAVSITLPASISAVTTGTVTVTDSNSAPVAGVVVRLSTNRGSITPSVFTNAQGQGTFTLTPGTTNTTATVTATLDGGITSNTTVTFVTIENPLLVSGGTKIDAHNVHVIVGQATPFIWQLYGGDGLPLASKSVVAKVTNGTITAGLGTVQSFATSTTSDGQVTFTYNSPITNGSTVLSFTDGSNKKIGSDILLKAVLAAPTGLVLTPKSDKEIDLTWQNSVGNYGYEIQRAQENNNPLTPLAWATIYTTTQNTTTYNDTRVPQSGTTYFYQIRALAPAGQTDFNSDFTASQQAATFPKKPLLHVPAVSDITDTSVKLTWEGTAENFGVYSSPDSITWSLIQTAPGNNDILVLNTATVSVLASSKQYFRIIANSGGVASVPSDPVFVTALPPAPTGLALTVVSSSQINMTWNAVAGASSYSISRKTAADVNFTVIEPALNSATLSYNNTGLLAGTTYFYKVGASIGIGASSYSMPVSAMTKLATPTNVVRNAAIATTDTTIDITWTGVTGADGYQLLTSTTGSAPWSLNTITPHVGAATSTQSGKLTGLTANTTYFIMVVASANASGNNSDGSFPAVIKTLPGAPAGLTITATSDKALSLNLTVNPLVDYYELERSTVITFATIDRAWSASGTEFPYSDTGLTGGKTYYYHVRSVTGGVTSAWSAVRSGTTLPSAPVLVSAIPTDTTVTLNWTGNGNSYNVESSPNGITYTLLATVPAVAGPNQTTIVSSTPSTTTYYRVIALVSAVTSAPSNALVVTTKPAAPTGMTLVAGADDKTITVNWTPVATATSYTLERSISNAVDATGAFSNAATVRFTATTADLPLADDTLTGGTRYYYHVRANIGINTSGWSIIKNAQTRPSAPTNVAIDAVTPVSDTTMRVTWTGVTGADNYTVTYTSLLGTNTVNVPQVGIATSTQSADLSSLTPNTSYTISVTAAIGTGGSALISQASTSVKQTTKTAAPVGLTVTALNATTLTLGITVDPLVTYYEVERSLTLATNVDGSFTTPDGPSGKFTLAGSQFPYNNTGLLSSTLYYYHVRGTLAGVKSAWTVAQSGKTLPAAPVLVSAVPNDTTVTLNWTGVGDYFNVESSLTGAAPWTTLATVQGTVFSTTVLATPATTIFYRVISSVGGIASAPSNSLVATTKPLAPAALTITQGTDEKSLVANFTPVAGATSYDLARSLSAATNADGSFVTVDGSLITLTAADLPYKNTGLTGGTTYYYTVRAHIGASTSGWSTVKSAQTLPAAPTNLVVNAATITDTTLDVSWTGVVGADNYIVSYITGAGPAATANVSHVGAANSTQTTTLSGLVPGTQYTITVVAAIGTGGTALKSAASLAVIGKTLSAAPTGLSVTALNATTLTLAVTVDPLVTLYEVERSKSLATNANGTFTTPDGATKNLSGTQFPYNDTGLTAATVYYYHIRGTKSGVKSAWSNITSGTTSLTTPTGVTVNSVASTDTSLELNWTGVTGADYYTLSYVGLAVPITVPHVGAANATQVYTFDGLTAATSYSFTVVANSISGAKSATSLAVTGKTLPASPAGLVITALDASTLTIGVTVDPLVTLYEVERSKSLATNANGTFTTLDGAAISLSGSQFPYNNTGLTANTVYYYHIRSTKAGVKSAWSNIISGTTNLATPTGVTVNTVASTDTSLELDWTGVTGANYYTVTYVGLAVPITVPHVGAANSAQSYTFTGLTAATSYTFTVVANSSTGAKSATSLPVTGKTLPAAPVGLAVTAVNASTLSLAVTVNPLVTLYEVERSKSPLTNANGSFTTPDGAIKNLSGTQFPYSDTGLIAATTYYYHIRGTVGGVKSTWSAEVSGVTSLATPTGIVINTVASTDRTLQLNWTGVTGADYYTVTYAGLAVPILVPHVGAANATQSYTFDGLTPGTSYSFTVVANNNSGSKSATSLPVVGKTLPAAPTGLTVTAVNASSITVGVTVDPLVTIYEVERSKSPATNADGSFTTPDGAIRMINGSIFPYTETGLTAWTTYYYHVRGTTAGVKSAWSAAVGAVTNLTTPTGVTVNIAASTDTTLELDWTGVTGADYYTLTYVGLLNPITVAHVGAANAPQSHTFTGLTAGTSYDFTVKANNNGGAVSALSLPANGKTLPAAPAGFTVTALNANTLKLAVTVDPLVTLYEVERSKSLATNADGTFTTLDGTKKSLTGSQFPYNDTGLTANTVNYYHIRGTKAGVKSAWSNEVSGTTNLGTPTGVTINIIASSDTTLELNWTGVTGADYYTLSYVGLANPIIVPQTGAANSTQVYTFTGLTAVTSYQFTVIANSNDGATSATTIPVTGKTLPAAPTGLLITSLNATTLKLAVTVDPLVTLYEVERSLSLATNPNGTFVTPDGAKKNLTGAQFPYNDTGLIANTIYYYHVRGTTGGAKSAWSAEVSGQTGLTTPTNVTVDATASTSTSLTVTWTGVTGADNYVVEATEGANTVSANTLHVGAVNATQTYTLNGLKVMTQYTVTVTAKQGAGATAPTSAASVPVTAMSLPGAPSALKLTLNAASYANLTLGWTEVTSIVSYEIQRTETAVQTTIPDALTTIYSSTGTGVVTFSDVNLKGNTWYNYRIRAVYNGLKSAWTPTSSILTLPTAPTALTAVPTDTQATIGWTEANSTGVVYQINAVQQVDATKKTDFGVTGATTFNATGLAPNTAYFFTITAINDSGKSTVSQPILVTTLAPAPTGLTVTVLPGKNLQLNWTKQIGAIYYEVERSTDGLVKADGSFITGTKIGTVTDAELPYTDTLTTDGRYFYHVRALIGGILTAWSNIAAGNTSPNSRPVVTADLTSITDTTVKISWTGGVGAASFDILQNTDGVVWATPGDIKGKVPSNVNTFTVTGLTPNTTNYIRVDAVVGQTALGVDIIAASSDVIQVITAPAAPVIQSATAISGSQINLKWPDVVNNSGYDIQRSIDSSFATTTTLVNPTSVSGGIVTYVDTGLSSGTQYFYRVRSKGIGTMTSSWSVISGLTFPTKPTVPVTDNTTVGQIGLSWTAPVNNIVDSYNIQFKSGSGAAWVNPATDTTIINTANTDYTFTGLPGNATYSYRVQSVNASGVSSWTTQVSATTSASGLILISAVPQTTTSVRLAWSGVNGATSLKIQQSVNDADWSDSTTNPTTLTVTDVTADVTGLTPGTTYFFRVVETNVGGSTNSNSVSTATLSSAPFNLAAAQQKPGLKVKLTWSAPTTPLVLNGYKVQRTNQDPALAPNSWTLVTASVDKAATAYIDNNVLTVGTLYYYRIAALTPAGSSDWSTVATVTIVPGSPATVTASNINNTTNTVSQATISWAPVAGAIRYEYQRINVTLGETWPADNVNTSTALLTTVTDGTLAVGEVYQYRVRAVVADTPAVVASDYSTAITVATCPQTGDISIQTLTPTTNSITLSWIDQGAGVVYDIYHAIGTGTVSTAGVPLFTTAAGQTTYIHADGSTTPGTAHSYIIRAKLAQPGNPALYAYSTYSAQATTTTKLSTITGVQASDIDSSTIKVTWPTMAAADSYVVQYRITGTNDYTPASGTVVTEGLNKSMTIGALQAQTSYDVTVQARNTTTYPGYIMVSDPSDPVVVVTFLNVPSVASVTVFAQAGTERIYYSQGVADQLSHSALTSTDLTVKGLDALGLGAAGSEVTFSISNGIGTLGIVSPNEILNVDGSITGTLDQNGQMIVNYRGRITNSATQYTPIAKELGLPQFSAVSGGATKTTTQIQATPIALVGPPALVVLDPAGITTINSDQIATITGTVYDAVGQKVLNGMPMEFTATSNLNGMLPTNSDFTFGDGNVRYPFSETSNGQVTSEFSSNHSGLYTIKAIALKNSGIDTGIADQLYSGTVTGTTQVRNRTYMSFANPTTIIENFAIDYPKSLNVDGTNSALITIVGTDDDGKQVLPGIPFSVQTSLGKIQLLNGTEFLAGQWAQDPTNLSFNNNGKAFFFMRADKTIPVIGQAFLSFNNNRLVADTYKLTSPVINFVGPNITTIDFTPNQTLTPPAGRILSIDEPRGPNAITSATLNVKLADGNGNVLPAGYAAVLQVDGADFGPTYIWSGATGLWGTHAWNTDSPFIYSSNAIGQHTLALRVTDPVSGLFSTTNAVIVTVTAAATAIVTPNIDNANVVASPYTINATVYDANNTLVVNDSKVDFYVSVQNGTYNGARYIGSALTTDGHASISWTPDISSFSAVSIAVFVDRNGNSFLDGGEQLGTTALFRIIAVPTGLTYSLPITDNSIPLTWNATVGADQYQLYRNGIQVATPLTNSYTDVVPNGAAVYSYTLRAVSTDVNYGCTSVLSSPAVVVDSAPAPVTLTTVDTITTTTARIHLVANTTDPTATIYRVYDNSNNLIQAVPITAQPYINVTGLTAGVDYTFKVSVLDTTLTPTTLSPYSNTVSFSTLPNTVTLPAISVDTINTTSVKLHWNTVTGSGITGYNIYGGPISPLFVPGVGISNYTVNGLSSGTAYTFYVTAVDAFSESVPSANINTITKPSVVTQLAPTNATPTGVTFNWVASADPAVIGYNLYLDNIVTPVATALATDTAKIVNTAISSGTNHTLYVRSYVTGPLESADSPGVSTQSLVVAPNPVVLNAATAMSTTNITFNWTISADTNVTGYELFIDGVSQGTVAPRTLATKAITGVYISGSTYSLKIRAITAFNQSIDSNTVNALIP